MYITMCLYIIITILLLVLSIYPFIKALHHHHSIITIRFSYIMGKWHYLGNYGMSQWAGDVGIDTKQSCNRHPRSLTQDPDGSKTWIFYFTN